MTRLTRYEKGWEDGINAIREELGDAVAILKDELARAWLTDPARIALNTLENFINER